MDEIVRRIVAKVGLGFNLPMPKLVLFGLRGLQNEGNAVAASRHLTPICRGKWRSLGEDIGTTDRLAHNQDVVGTFLRGKLLALREVVGANGFEPSTSWSRTSGQNHISRCPGVTYWFSGRSLMDKSGQVIAECWRKFWGINSKLLDLLTILRLTAEKIKNLNALSGVAYQNSGAIFPFLVAPNPAPKPALRYFAFAHRRKGRGRVQRRKNRPHREVIG